MAWETSRGRPYYYRRKQIGSRVVSEFVGTGLFGLFIELEDLAKREEREEEIHQIRELVTLSFSWARTQPHCVFSLNTQITRT
jgi:hypothetical protein